MKLGKKIVALILVATFAFSPLFAKKAEAQYVDWANLVPNTSSAVTSWGMWTKEYVLDPIAYAATTLMIQRMTADTINWINSGFRGSPAFVTDPAAYFMDIGDKVVGDFILNDPNLNFLCAPIQAQIRLALLSSYNRPAEAWRCTLTDVVGNIDGFMNDFSQGGWDAFFELSQRQQNNPIGAYIMAEAEMNRQLAQSLSIKQDELNWGRGFMSFEKCIGTEDADGFCNGYLEIQTPGSVIEGQLGEVLSIGGKRLAVADEINEIVGALLSQLVVKAFGSLRGLSQSSASGPAVTGQLSNQQNDDAIQEYFNTANTSLQGAINTPSPTFCTPQNPNAPECVQPQGTSGTGSIVPSDRDCIGIDQITLGNMVADSMRVNPSLTWQQAVMDLDCGSPGIN